MNQQITKDNILDYLVKEDGINYHFRFPGISKELVVKLSGNMLHFKNDKKLGEGITEAIIEEVKSEAFRAYEIFSRNNRDTEQVQRGRMG